MGKGVCGENENTRICSSVQCGWWGRCDIGDGGIWQ